MAVVKWDPSKKQKFADVITSSAGISQMTDTVLSKKSANSKSFSHFYCKRVITEKPEGKEPIVTRIEEVSFGYKPSRYQRKSLHPPKPKSASKHLDKRSRTEKRENNIKKNLYKICALGVIFGCKAFLWWFLTTSNCQLVPLVIDDFEASLRSEVIGQEEAINSLILTFYRASNLKTQPPVLLLCGSTGVGKSFITDIIIKNFESIGHAEILHHPVPSPNTIVEKLDRCRHNLLVLDGLHISDAPETANWTSEVQQAANFEGKQVWLILAFTTWSWSPDDITESDAEFLEDITKISEKIEELFNRNSVATQLIAMKPLEVHHIRICVRRALLRMSLVASEQAMEKIIDDLTGIPEKRRRGCKHVSKYLLQSRPDVVSLKENHEAVSNDEF